MWYQELEQAFAMARKPINLGSLPEAWLKQAGFEDIKKNIKEIPYHPWPNSEFQRDVGRWFNLAMVHALEAMSMAVLTRYKNYTKDQVTTLISEVKKDICTRSYRSHCTM